MTKQAELEAAEDEMRIKKLKNKTPSDICKICGHRNQSPEGEKACPVTNFKALAVVEVNN